MIDLSYININYIYVCSRMYKNNLSMKSFDSMSLMLWVGDVYNVDA